MATGGGGRNPLTRIYVTQTALDYFRQRNIEMNEIAQYLMNKTGAEVTYNKPNFVIIGENEQIVNTKEIWNQLFHKQNPIGTLGGRNNFSNSVASAENSRNGLSPFSSKSTYVRTDRHTSPSTGLSSSVDQSISCHEFNIPQEPFEQILTLTDVDVLKFKFFCYKVYEEIRHSPTYRIKTSEHNGNVKMIVYCKKSFAREAHEVIADVLKRTENLSEESIDFDIEKFKNAKTLVQDFSDADVLVFCGDNTVFFVGKLYDQVLQAKRKFQIELGTLRVTTRDRTLKSCDGAGITQSLQSADDSSRSNKGQSLKDTKSSISLSANSSALKMKPYHLQFTTREGLIVKIYAGSITRLEVDAIVNAANDVLMHGGGVAKVISIGAGRQFDKESYKYVRTHGKLGVTEACVTSAGDLPYRGVIHAVGPQWAHYSKKSECLFDLYFTIKNVLKVAARNKFGKVAMPAISAGIFGVPKPFCADMYVKALVDYSKDDWLRCPQYPKEFHIVDIDDAILKLVEKSYHRWQINPADIQPTKVDYGFNTITNTTGTASGISEVSPMRPSVTIKKLQTQKTNSGHEVLVFGVADKLKVKISSGDLSLVDSVDAIICSADPYLTGAGQLSQTIATRAGKKYRDHFENIKRDSLRKKIYLGDMFKCSGGNLQVCYVVHVVIDTIINTKHGKEMAELEEIFCRVLETTNEWGFRRIAMPLLGASLLQRNKGALQSCCEVLYQAVVKFCSERGTAQSLNVIELVNMNPEITGLLVKIFSVAVKNDHLSLSRPFTAPNMRRQRPNPKYHSEYVQGTNEEVMDYYNSFSDDENEPPKTPQSLTDPSTSYPSRTGNPQGNLIVISSDAIGTSSDVIDEDSCSKCGLNFIEGSQTQMSCGHIFCLRCFTPIKQTSTCSVCNQTDITQDITQKEDCVICMDGMTNPKKLKCGHEFCKDCIDEMFKHKPACPICNTIYGKVCGSQPDGHMEVKEYTFPSLPGFEDYGTIEINYSFMDGIQNENHPNPGKAYRGARRTAYLPNNSEGRKVLTLLKIAFDRRLVFTIGVSRTTGRNNVVTWNDIHHKTRQYGGPERFGYPDDTYLSRVQEELAAKGITEECMQSKRSGTP
ncbi:hypothetical protein ScPMuIL_001751 [Solemya velum]